MIILRDLGTWRGELPMALVRPCDTLDARRALLRSLVGAACGCSPEAVAIGHERDRRPRLLRPADAALVLSSSSRGGVAAAAIGRCPVGVDVERIAPGAALPLSLLHRGERDHLRSLDGAARDRAFAVIWACKEAYVKALGTGFATAPETVCVAATGHRATVTGDGGIGQAVLAAIGPDHVAALVSISSATGSVLIA